MLQTVIRQIFKDEKNVLIALKEFPPQGRTAGNTAQSAAFHRNTYQGPLPPPRGQGVTLQLQAPEYEECGEERQSPVLEKDLEAPKNIRVSVLN